MRLISGLEDKSECAHVCGGESDQASPGRVRCWKLMPRAWLQNGRVVIDHVSANHATEVGVMTDPRTPMV